MTPQMHLSAYMLLFCNLFAPVIGSQLSSQTSIPTGLALSTTLDSAVGYFQEFELSTSTPVATLDYGHEKAGYPFFDIDSVSGKVQIEVKYSEEFSGLNNNFSDGPLSYTTGLSNTFRVETFEVTTPGILQAYFLQGGQRWESIRLLTDGRVKFKSAGLILTIPDVNATSLPGTFSSSDDDFNKIWSLGARAADLSCLPKGSQKAMWEVGTDGTFVRGMKSAVTSQGAFFEDYTLRFKAKIERGGLSWVVAYPLASPAKGIQLHLVGDQPDGVGFVNANHTLLPPNSIVLGYGYSIVNITTLPSYYLDRFKIPFKVAEEMWYNIETVLTNQSYISVSLDNQQIFNVSLTDYYIGGGKIPTAGSFGFGAWQDQSAYFRDVEVYDTANQTIIYQNNLTNESTVLTEYGVQENTAAVCLDGPKRDRLIWLGDFYHTVRVLGASTSQYTIAKGTLQWLLEWQTENGLLPYAPPIGYSPSSARNAFAMGGGGLLKGYPVWAIILPDYQILGLLSFCEYVRISGDIQFAKETWSQWQLLATWILAQVSATTGLPVLVGGFLGPGNSSSAISCATLQAIKALADVATAVGDSTSATTYQKSAETLAQSINDQLWNPDLGVYSLSLASPADYSVSGIAFCIISGAANDTQARSSLAALSNLAIGPGYADSTLANASDPSLMISPNTNGFLLEAIASQYDSNRTIELIKNLWKPMIANPETSSGASWEYVSVSGDPGYGLFTSLSHPWGGAPTYVLPEYVTGLQTGAGPDGYGYKEWLLRPKLGLDIGLRESSAKVVTAFGEPLEVKWSVDGDKLSVSVNAPNITTGTFELDGETKLLAGNSVYEFIVQLS